MASINLFLVSYITFLISLKKTRKKLGIEWKAKDWEEIEKQLIEESDEKEFSILKEKELIEEK